jgi:hypothetical protein
MVDGSFDNPTPQFSTAEYTTPPGNYCQICKQPVLGTYFRLNEAMACPGCVEKIRTEMSVDKHAAFVRAVAHGIGAAILGMIGYALIAILLQGWVISYMSIGVGWLVGTAMMRGSKGVGGRRYQIAAAVLTYAAVSIAAIPIWIHFAGQREQHRQTQQQQLEEEQRQLEKESGQQPATPQPAPKAPTPQLSVLTVGKWLGRLTLLGLASPFIQLSDNPLWGGLGLLILFIGIRIAWRIAAGRPLQIYGPFDDSPQPAR